MPEDSTKTIDIRVEDIKDAVSGGYQAQLAVSDLEFPACRRSVDELPVQEKLAELEKRTDFVKTCMKNITANFLRVGRMLAGIRDNFDFTQSEYLTFYAFCTGKFDLGKTTVVNLIKVYELFSDRIRGEEKYRRYSYSQLAEMVPLAGLPVEEKITPAFTVTQIRALKQELKRKQKGTESTETRKNKKQLPDTVFKFADDAAVRKFLMEYQAWEIIGEVQAIAVTFFRCFLSTGIQFVAEQIGVGKGVAVYYHWVNEEGVFINSAHDLQKAVDFLMRREADARLVPFEPEDVLQAKMVRAAKRRLMAQAS